MNPRRSGMALLITLLGVLTIEIVVAGLFHVSLLQLRIAQAQTRNAQLQAAAQAGVAGAIARWHALHTDGLLPNDSLTLTGTDPATEWHTRTVVRALGGRLFLLRAQATSPQHESRAVAALVRTTDLRSLLDAIGAVVVARTAAGQGAIDGSAPAACAIPDSVPAQLTPLALSDSAGAGPLARGALIRLAEPPSFPTIAGIDLRRIDWSSSAQDSSRAAAVTFTHQDFTVADSAAGILIVDGDVTLEAAARFAGVIVASGVVRLLPGARVDGLIQANRIELLDAAVRYDPCALRDLLLAHPSLSGPFRASPHWWLPFA